MTALNSDRLPVPTNDEEQLHRAGLACVNTALAETGDDPRSPTESTRGLIEELLFEVGIKPDPRALIRIKGHSRIAANQTGAGQ